MRLAVLSPLKQPFPVGLRLAEGELWGLLQSARQQAALLSRPLWPGGYKRRVGAVAWKTLR